MNYEEWPYGRATRRRGPAWFVSLLMGLLGVVFGAVLVYGLFVYYVLPEPPPDPGNGQATGYGPLLPSPQGMDAADVVSRVMPAVVGVDNYVYLTRRGENNLAHRGSGSGVVISEDGYIVTNHHVVEGADKVIVVFPDAGKYPAEIVGTDPLTDLALLKINKEQLTHIPLGDSSMVRIGETVLAIGNPLGFEQTVTAGIISSVERQVRIPGTWYYYTFFQTDAGINAGNSGGPLINLRGEVIGINSLKLADWGVEAIGFAIPSNTVLRVAGDLREHGKVRRPMLGVSPQPPEESTVERGVQINEILSGTPAEQSGLQEGDVIIGIGTKEINYLAQLYAALLDYYPDDQIEVIIIRDGREQTFTVTLAEREDDV